MMHFGNELKKAMVDCDINGAVALSKKANVSYGKVIRALNGEGSSRYVDILQLATVLNLKIQFIQKESSDDELL
jgi:DNA-binding phage protein